MGSQATIQTQLLPSRRLGKTAHSMLASSALALLAACSGAMDGMVRGEGTRVTFKYEQGMDRDFYESTIDGERFKGQAVHADARTGVSHVAGRSVVVTSTSGNLVAVMFGDRGSTMRCNMNYANSSGFTTMGGVGVCRHSDGRMIDIMW